MKKRNCLWLIILMMVSFVFAGCSADNKPQSKEVKQPVLSEKKGTKTMNPIVEIVTSRGNLTLELFEDAAPNTVTNFIHLVEQGFYNGMHFHRVIPNFMIQGGCPHSKPGGKGMPGTGGPGYRFADEINVKAFGFDKLKVKDADFLYERRSNPSLYMQFADKSVEEMFSALGYTYTDGLPSEKNVRGTLSMANAGPNTNGSQFFINHVNNVHLDGKHTVFGKVTENLSLIDKIQKDDEIKEMKVISKRDHAYEMPKIVGKE